MKFQEERAKIDRGAEKMPDIIFIRELTGTLDLKLKSNHLAMNN